MAYIEENKINEIRNSVNIVDIIKEYVPLTSKGKNFFGVCPFHEDHAPSMSVSSDKQIYRCFSCGAAGNVFTFVKDYENVSFLEAVSIVAKKAGISFDFTNNEKKTESKYSDLFKITSDSSKFFQNNLYTKDGERALDYLKRRGFNDEAIKELGFGLSTFNNSLLTFLEKKGYTASDIDKTSLISLDGKPHDVFVNRIMIPIHDLDGNIVGFTGRDFNNSDGPKYINSKESVIFKKGMILFNYHRAKDYVRNNHELIIVEGNMDALKMYSSGIKNVIALMGTALTTDHVNAIKKMRSKVILMMDNDDAGKLGMYQNGNILKKNGIDPEIVLITNAKDPDEYITNFGVDKFNNILKSRESFLNYKLEYFKNGLNLDDVSDLSKYIKLVLSDLKNENDKVLIEVTTKKLAKDYGLDYNNLISDLIPDTGETKSGAIKIEKENKEVNLRIDEAVANIILGMASNGKYIKLFIKQLGFLPEKWQRNIVNEIRYYYEQNKTINLADFISYLSDKIDMQNIVLEMVSKYGDLEITDELFNEYIHAEKKILLNKEIKEVKELIKKEKDINKKLELGEKLTKLKKDVEKNGSN
ncbi:MAG: DNA primase [Bacilli bacterium]|nr:DNA primase [Bacilli bacterium]